MMLVTRYCHDTPIRVITAHDIARWLIRCAIIDYAILLSYCRYAEILLLLFIELRHDVTLMLLLLIYIEERRYSTVDIYASAAGQLLADVIAAGDITLALRY